MMRLRLAMAALALVFATANALAKAPPKGVRATIDAITLAADLYRAGDYPAALTAVEKGLAQAERHFGLRHQVTGIALNNKGLILRRLGRLFEADIAFNDALRIRQARASDKRGRADLAATLDSIGQLALERGDKLTAVSFAWRAVEAADAAELSAGSVLGLAYRVHLGESLLAQDRIPEAHPILIQAVRAGEATLGKDSPELIPAYEALATLNLRQDAPETARALIERALELARKGLPKDSPVIGRLQARLDGLPAAVAAPPADAPKL